MSDYPTCFSEIFGNDSVKKQLSCMISKNAIGHSLLFAGPEGIGKSLFAWVLAAKLFAQDSGAESHLHKIRMGMHPDIHFYRPEGKLGLHTIQSMRQLKEEVCMPPYEAKWKLFIIHDADRMLSYSANALLKTFEEPPPQTLIILLSRSQSSLLPTILSRCRVVHFQPLSSDSLVQFVQKRYQLEEAACLKIALQAQGSVGRAVRLAEQGEDHMRIELLHLLARGPLSSYRALQEAVKSLSDKMEEVKKQAEQTAKEELLKSFTDQLSAQQQQSVEKELEGLLSLAFTQEAQIIFEHLLSWYRDMQSLLLGGDRSHLINHDFYDALASAIKRGESLPLDKVFQHVEEAYLSLQRSTSFSICLETLLLKLKNGFVA